MKRFAPILLLAWLPLRVAAGSDPAGPPSVPSSPTMSVTHRFVVAGMLTADNLALANAAEDAAGRIETFMGLHIPFTRGECLALVVEAPAAGERGRVVKAQGWVDRRLEQKLYIRHIEAVNQEEILEGLCWLLLNRFVINLQDTQARQQALGTVPQWCSTGLAQSLFTSLRARNRRYVWRRWKENGAFTVRQILDWEYLPEGRWSEKACAGLAVEWMGSMMTGPRFWTALFERRARGEPVTAEWLARIALGVEDPRELEKSWDVWVAAQEQVRTEMGSASDEQCAALREQSVIRPAQWGIEPEKDVPEILSLEDLPSYRDRPWMVPLITRLGLNIQSVGIGQPETFQRVIAGYVRYLDAIPCGPGKSWASKLLHPCASESRLKNLLRDAGRSLDEFERDLRDREQYVTEIEERLASEAVLSWREPSRAAGAKPPSAAAMRRYVDKVERRLKKQASDAD